MKCDKCGQEFEEKDLADSHDVPCYLFNGNRQGRSNQADKFGRHWLCKKQGVKEELFCHDKYEIALQHFLRLQSILFAKNYFKEDEHGDTKTNPEL
jgi:hypothetical protein